jgi:hypothetical protein
MGSVPPVDSITMSDQRIPVEIFTEATCEIEILSSLLPNRRRLTRLTRSVFTTMRVGKKRFPLVQRLALKVSSDAAGFASAELIRMETILTPNRLTFKDA